MAAETQKETLEKLIALGTQILSLPKGKADEFVVAIEEYAQKLDGLLAPEGTLDVTGELRPLAEKLLEVHARVMKGAETTKGDTAKFLSSLQARGRGLRAYVDPLPKRISTRKPREG